MSNHDQKADNTQFPTSSSAAVPVTASRATAGPWRVGYADGSGGGNPDDYNDYFVITSVADGEEVVSGTSGDTSDMRSYCYGIENEDDARLIAAAPDLLTACQAIETFFVFFGTNIPPGRGDGARDALQMVHDAIGKATNPRTLLCGCTTAGDMCETHAEAS